MNEIVITVELRDLELYRKLLELLKELYELSEPEVKKMVIKRLEAL